MSDDSGSGRKLADKFKNPFQNIKQTLEDSLDNNQHLRDAKIHLSHKKCVSDEERQSRLCSAKGDGCDEHTDQFLPDIR